MSKAMTETNLSHAIQTALKKLGFRVIRINSGGRRGRIQLAPPGTPDLYVLGGGWLELKLPGKKLSPAQEAWHAEAKALGERVETVSSVAAAVNFALSWRAERAYEESMGWR